MRPRERQPNAELGMWRRHKPDYAIVVLMGVLLILGLVIIYSISPALSQRSVEEVSDNHFMYRQMAYIALGIAAFTVTSMTPLKLWSKWKGPILIVGLVASLLVLVPGIGATVNGASRWIDLGGFTFQPAELLKFGLIFYFASFLCQRIKNNTLADRSQTLWPIMAIIGGLGLLIVVAQRDMGTMLVFVGIIAIMFFVAGAKLKDLAIMGGSVIGAGVAAIILFPHRLERVLTFLDPASDAQGTGYHINQALIAVGSGGWFGRGLGRSVQVFGYLPEPANDSIFAIFAEKFGFVGSVVVMLLFGALFIRIIQAINSAPSMHMKLVASGVFAWLFSHTIINIGAMLSLLPLTGITLPFLSFGGTSLVMIMAGLGVVFNISRYTDLSANVRLKEANGESSSHGWRNRRTRLASSSRSF